MDHQEHTEPPKLTDLQAETIYALGHQAYQNGQYAKAATIFNGLAIARKNDVKYWQALAATQQMQKKYDKAVEAYLVACALNPQDPKPYVHSAECLWHQGQKQDALTVLNTAASVASRDKKTNRNLLKQVELYKQVWSNTDQVLVK